MVAFQLMFCLNFDFVNQRHLNFSPPMLAPTAPPTAAPPTTLAAVWTAPPTRPAAAPRPAPTIPSKRPGSCVSSGIGLEKTLAPKEQNMRE